MNARLYDPASGRFLSPDPFLQNPLFSQNFNRYSYCLNNPLCYIDRDGQFVWFIPVIASIVGCYIGGSMANHSYNPLNWDWSSGKTWGYMGGGALIGGGGALLAMCAGPAIGGAICTGIGMSTGGVIGGTITGLVGGAISGFVNGAGFTALGGGSFKDSMIGGLKGAAIGGGTGAITGGILGGVNAYKGGYNVWSGEAIKEGRNAFSFKNTPLVTKPAPPSEPIPVTVGNVDVPQPNSSPILNSKGDPYPDVTVEGYGKVPFPEGPYTPNNSATLRPEFNALRSDFKNWWIEQGRPYPIATEGSTIQIHHIQPLSWGGTNSFNNLVPLIYPQQHQPFTNWWLSFKITF